MNVRTILFGVITGNKSASLAAARLLWKFEKAYSLGIPKNKLALGVSQTEEEHAYARRYTIFWSKGRSFWTGSVERSVAGKGSGGDFDFGGSRLKKKKRKKRSSLLLAFNGVIRILGDSAPTYESRRAGNSKRSKADLTPLLTPLLPIASFSSSRIFVNRGFFSRIQF